MEGAGKGEANAEGIGKGEANAEGIGEGEANVQGIGRGVKRLEFERINELCKKAELLVIKQLINL